jgi:hypothetical protein
VAHRSTSSGVGSSATPSVPAPAGVQAGDIIIVKVNIDAVSAAFDPVDLPTGFTEFDEFDTTFDGQTHWIGWKRTTGADTGSYTFGSVGTAGDWVAIASAYSGRHATNPPVISTRATGNATSSPASVAANGVTAVLGDDLEWVSSADVNANGSGNGNTPPSTFTEPTNGDVENAWANLGCAYKENVSAGATGTITGQFAFTAATDWVAWLVRIPAAATGTNATVNAVPAQSTGSAPAATVSAVTATSVVAVPALSAGSAPAAAIRAGVTVTAAPATSAGTAPPANQTISLTVNAPALMSLGSAPIATVSGGGTGATVTAVTAASAGSAPVASLQSAVTVTAVLADSVGSAPAGTVTQGSAVFGVPAFSSGQAPRPTVTPAPPGGSPGTIAVTFAEDTS